MVTPQRLRRLFASLFGDAKDEIHTLNLYCLHLSINLRHTQSVHQLLLHSLLIKPMSLLLLAQCLF